MQLGLGGVVASRPAAGAAGGTAAAADDGAEPVEVLVGSDADEGGDGLQADDGMVVSEERAEGVQPSREDEGRHEAPALAVLQVQEA